MLVWEYHSISSNSRNLQFWLVRIACMKEREVSFFSYKRNITKEKKTWHITGRSHNIISTSRPLSFEDKEGRENSERNPDIFAVICMFLVDPNTKNLFICSIDSLLNEWIEWEKEVERNFSRKNASLNETNLLSRKCSGLLRSECPLIKFQGNLSKNCSDGD